MSEKSINCYLTKVPKNIFLCVKAQVKTRVTQTFMRLISLDHTRKQLKMESEVIQFQLRLLIHADGQLHFYDMRKDTFMLR
jgi:hypothetical protein